MKEGTARTTLGCEKNVLEEVSQVEVRRRRRRRRKKEEAENPKTAIQRLESERAMAGIEGERERDQALIARFGPG